MRGAVGWSDLRYPSGELVAVNRNFCFEDRVTSERDVVSLIALAPGVCAVIRARHTLDDTFQDQTD